MARITSDLLNEAVLEAEAVRETAIANARLQLEESLAPALKKEIAEILKRDNAPVEEADQINEAANPQLGLDPQDFAKVAEGKESVDLKTSGVGSSGESGRTLGDDKTGPEPGATGGEGPSPKLTSSDIGNDGESSGRQDRGAAKGNKEGGEYYMEEEEFEGDELSEDLDLEAIIRELQADVDALNDYVEGEGGEEGEDDVDLDFGDDDEEEGYEDDEEEVDFGGEEEDEEEVDEDFDLDAVLAEIEAELAEEKEEYPSLAEENQTLKEELAEYRYAVQLLRAKLNEVNLLNTKLFYTTKLMRDKSLTTEQKTHIVETFDMATTIRETKLLYATLSEALIPQSKKRKSVGSKKVVTEGLASKPVGSTAPTSEEVLNEETVVEDAFRTRMQQLAGIKIL